MEERSNHRLLWIILIVVGLLLSCGLGALGGGLIGYAVGRNASVRGYQMPFQNPARPQQQIPVPEPRSETPSPRIIPMPPSFDLTKGGAVIVQITADSPAAAAGLQVGDIIVAVDNQSLGDTDLADLIHRYQPGDKVTFTVIRTGQQQTVEVTLGRNPDQDGNVPWVGLRYQTIPAGGNFRFQMPDQQQPSQDRWSS